MSQRVPFPPMLRVQQVWANYGTGAICGLLTFSIGPAELEEILLFMRSLGHFNKELNKVELQNMNKKRAKSLPTPGVQQVLQHSATTAVLNVSNL